MKRKIKFQPVLFSIVLILVLNACSPFQKPTLLPRPTPDVPPLSEIDATIRRWETGNNMRYFVEVEEITLEETRLIRVVIADGEVRAAQQLSKVEGGWSSPVPMDLQEAKKYTVDAILQRIRRDALGEGPAPMNMLAVFDPVSGYPDVVEAQALSTLNEQGQVVLNREHSYTLGVKVDVLIEDTIGLSKEPLLLLTRSGGTEAWCDNLRIFSDGSSVYTDDCRRTLLQLRPPSSSVATLAELSSTIEGINQRNEIGDGIQHLIVYGKGSSEPTDETLDETWALAEELVGLLSKPIGAGITLLYSQSSMVFGFDMRTLLAQPANLDIRGPLYGAIISPESTFVAYSDGRGLHWFDAKSGESGLFFSNPPDGRYALKGWSKTGQIILQRFQEREDGSPEWGWTSLNDRSWNPLPLSAGSFSCDDGVSLNPSEPELVIAVGSGGEECNIDAGLSLVGFEDGVIRQILDSMNFSGGGVPLFGGAFSPAWSPTGDWIAVVVEDELSGESGSPRHLYLVRPDGTELTRLTENLTGQASHPVWASDGRRLFYALDGTESGENGVYEYRFETGNQRLVIPGDNLAPQSVSPSDEFLAFYDLEGLNVWFLQQEQVFPVAFNSASGDTLFLGWLDATAGE